MHKQTNTHRKTNTELINMFVDYLITVEEKKNNTIASYYYDLTALHDFSVNKLENKLFIDFTQDDLELYLAHCHDIGKSINSVRRLISTIKVFFGYLVVERQISINPTLLIETPKRVKSIPVYLNEEQMQTLLAQPDTSRWIGLRDRAMLELIYSSGLRISELVNLTFDEVDIRNALLKIVGKGGKTRLVPISVSAIQWLKNYLMGYRNHVDILSPYIFTNAKGRPMTRNNFWIRINNYAKALHIDLKGFGPHSLRHSFATSLINNGADIRSVQSLLGHSSLTTTQIYTHMADDKIKELYENHQPGLDNDYQEMIHKAHWLSNPVIKSRDELEEEINNFYEDIEIDEEEFFQGEPPLPPRRRRGERTHMQLGPTE